MIKRLLILALAASFTFGTVSCREEKDLGDEVEEVGDEMEDTADDIEDSVD